MPFRNSQSPGVTSAALLILIALLALPAFAIYRQKIDLRWTAAYAAMVNLLTYYAYARDKRSAQESEWRTPEMRLHLLELAGGWPAAFLAQRRLRHKSSKVTYQIAFWLIVLLWQFVAFDAVQNWKYSHQILSFLPHAGT